MKPRVLFSFFRFLLLCVVCPIVLASCSSCDAKKSETQSAEAASAEPLPAAPDALLADVVITTPNASWHKLQTGIGGALGILPATLPGLFITLSELDPLLADQLDGTAPIYGVVAGDPVDPALAFAMKLHDPRKARGFLAEGESARFYAHEDAGLTEMVARSRPQDRKSAVAITKNSYLLVGRKAEDLRKLAAYVSVALPARPVPTDAAVVIDIPRSAIADVIRPRLDTAWKETKGYLVAEDERMRKEKGRAPDFGEPKAIVAAVDNVVTNKLEVFSDLEHVRIALDVQSDAVALAVDLTPRAVPGRARAWMETMITGDATPLLALPLASSFAMVTRDSEAERTAQEESFEKLLTTSLEGKFDEANAKRFHEVMTDFGKARGDWLAVAAVADEPTGGFLRMPVRDANAASRAMKGAIDLVTVAPFKDLLHAQGAVTSTDDKVSTTIIARDAKAAKKGEKVSPLGFSWTVQDGTLSFASGAEPAVVMKLGGKPEKKLSDDALAKRFTNDVGAASTFLALQPLRLDPKRANLPSSPVVLSVGKNEKNPVIRALVSDALLREATRSQMGF